MLSILIPVYNYPIKILLDSLYRELNTSFFNCEVIILDDCSTNQVYILENKNICTKYDAIYFVNKTNLGRTATRSKMAEIAKNDFLLFLDSDVTPVKNNFISTFVEEINNAAVVCGGIKYREKTPPESLMLRWKYGHKRESISVDNRIKKPYLSIISACFAIKKDIFISISNKLEGNNYGMDVLFAYEMEQRKLMVKHINNPVFHLGLETNLSFIKKTELAMKTIIELQNSNRIPTNYRPIQEKLQLLQRTKLSNLFVFFVSIKKKQLIKQLDSKNPNLFFFDIYKLYCLCLHNKQIN